MIAALTAGGVMPGTAVIDGLRPAQPGPATASGPDFGSVLQGIAASAVDTLRQGEAAAAQGIVGTMPVLQVVDQVLAAERTLQATLAIRDKLVGAYLEITRMQI